MANTYAKTKDGIRRLNTKVVDGKEEFFVELYQTLVYHEMADRIVLRNGGWVTPTTVSRIHQALRHRGHAHSVNINKGEMFCDGKPFVNGTYTIVKEAR